MRDLDEFQSINLVLKKANQDIYTSARENTLVIQNPEEIAPKKSEIEQKWIEYK